MNAPLLRFLIFLFLALSAAFGQQQDKKLIDRIQRPDMQLGNPLQSKSYEAATGINIKRVYYAEKNFSTSQSGAVKDFSGVRSFFGIKNPWFGKLTYDAKPATLGANSGFDPAKSYNVKSAATVPFKFPSTASQSPSQAVSTKSFLMQGKASGAMQQLSEKVRKEMTIDEVRELLNKPR